MPRVWPSGISHLLLVPLGATDSSHGGQARRVTLPLFEYTQFRVWGETCGVLGGGVQPEPTMWAHAIVLPAPALDAPLGVGEIEEELFVQALVAELVVEALAVGIVDRLAGSDEAERNPARPRPAEEGPGRELRSMIADETRREAPRPRRALERLDHGRAREGVVDGERRALARAVVDDGEHADRAARR